MVAGRPIEKHSFLVSRAGLRTCGPMAMRTNSEINHASRMVTKRRFRPERLSNRLKRPCEAHGRASLRVNVAGYLLGGGAHRRAHE